MVPRSLCLISFNENFNFLTWQSLSPCRRDRIQRRIRPQWGVACVVYFTQSDHPLRKIGATLDPPLFLSPCWVLLPEILVNLPLSAEGYHATADIWTYMTFCAKVHSLNSFWSKYDSRWYMLFVLIGQANRQGRTGEQTAALAKMLKPALSLHLLAQSISFNPSILYRSFLSLITFSLSSSSLLFLSLEASPCLLQLISGSWGKGQRHLERLREVHPPGKCPVE